MRRSATTPSSSSASLTRDAVAATDRQVPADTFCMGRCTRRKQSPYIPQLPRGLRWLYDASCFGWLLVVFGLLWHGGDPRMRPYGVLLTFMLSLQSVLSYMGDSYEFLSTGVPGGPWGRADQLWAVSTIALSVLFVASNGMATRGVIAYAGCLLCGAACWIGGIITLRVEGGSPIVWACCHICWHVLLCAGGIAAALSLEPV